MTDVFATGQRAAHAPVATSMAAVSTIVVDHQIRCAGEHRGRPCRKLLAERAGRPHTHVCPRCGFRNDVPLPL